MQREWVVWQACPSGNSCVLEPPEGISRGWELYEGVSRVTTFDEDACFRMYDRYPKNVSLPDCLMNLAGLIVIHARLVAFLQTKSLLNVEFLPVSIINHKGRVASRDYCILHPTKPEDCLDLVASGVTFSAVIPTDIIAVDKLVLDYNRIAPDLHIFRIAHFGVPILVSRGLADEIIQANFTGVTFTELERYGG